jgi:hypothetical protein
MNTATPVCRPAHNLIEQRGPFHRLSIAGFLRIRGLGLPVAAPCCDVVERGRSPPMRQILGPAQQELDAIAWKLNTRPRKLHGFRSPIEVYDEHLAKARTRPDL